MYVCISVYLQFQSKLVIIDFYKMNCIIMTCILNQGISKKEGEYFGKRRRKREKQEKYGGKIPFYLKESK